MIKNSERLQEYTNKPYAIDLFCGCGGTTIGLKQAGFDVIAAVDLDPLALATYKANHPKVKLYEEDIRNVEPIQLAFDVGLGDNRLDLLAGCPPCQGFSTMRTLNGALKVDDPRNDLLAEFTRFVKNLLPRAIMLENVPGLMKDSRFIKFIKQMDQLGYIGKPKILNAADYLVPQRRKRLIYMAGYGFEIPYAASKGKFLTVRKAIGNLPKAGSSGDSAHDLKGKHTDKVKEIIRMVPHNGGSRKDLPEEYWLDCHKKCSGFKDVYGRMAWDEVAPTITGGCFNPSKGRFLHPEEDRAITMREASLLQGFPKNFKFPNVTNKSALALIIGNALPPPFVKAHAISIRKSLMSNKRQ